MTGHSLALHAVFDAEVSRADAQRVLRDAPGVIVADDPEHGEYPTPADAVGTDPTWVGRIRQNQDDPHALELFVVGDNLRKGAALNAAQIAELLVPEFAARAASVAG
jgi:aspartate-semialdehyde dehydrogenase